MKEFFDFGVDYFWLLGLAVSIIVLAGPSKFVNVSTKKLLLITTAIIAVVMLGFINNTLGLIVYIISAIALFCWFYIKLGWQLIHFTFVAALLEITLTSVLKFIVELNVCIFAEEKRFDSFMNIVFFLVAVIGYMIAILLRNKSYISLYIIDTKTEIVLSIVLVWNILMIIAMNAALNNLSEFEKKSNVIMLLFFTCVGLLIQVYSFLKLVKVNQLLKEKDNIQSKYIEAQEDHYSELINRDMKLRRFKHDFINHMDILDDLLSTGDYGEAQKYLEKIKEFKGQINYLVHTNNALADIVVNKYVELARKKEIDLLVSGSLPVEMTISKYDFSTIVFNLLENAMEAEEKSGKKKIILEFRYNDKYIFIKVENDYEGDILVVNNRIESTKLDRKNHGFGLQNVNQCIQNNDGSIEYEAKDQKMSILIALKNRG